MRRMAGLVAAALALGACGGGGSTAIEIRTVPQARITEAAAASVAAESSRLEIAIEVKAGDESVALTAQGTQTLGTVTEDTLADISFGGAGGDLTFDARVIGNDIYYLYGKGFDLPADVEWVHLAYEDLLANVPEDRRAEYEQLLEQQSQYDATQYLDYLENIGSDVEDVGADTVRGEPARRYRLRLELDEFAEQFSLGSSLGSLNAEQKKVAAAIVEGLETVETEVWVDDAGRLVRMQMLVEIGDIDIEGAPDRVFLLMNVEMFDFGVPVEVVAPPADQITEFADLLARQAV